MTLNLYRAELARLSGSLRVRWIAGAICAMILLAVASSWIEAKNMAREIEQIEAAERERWLNQDPKNPHSAAHYGQWLFKRASPLAILDPGVDPYVGRMMRVEAHHYNDAVFRSVQDGGPLAASGIGAVADIVHLIVALAAILLGFAAFALDRERGTLRLALGNGARAGPLLTARFCALMTMLGAAVVIPTILAGTLAILTLETEGWQAGARLAVWIASELVYLAMFLGMSLIASLLANTARSALAISLLAWALSCVLVPRLATAGIEAIAPTPSQQQMFAAVERQTREYNRAENEAVRREALLASYGATSEDEVPIDVTGALGHAREQHDYAAYDAGLASFNAALERQDRLAGWAGLVSPMIAIQSISQAVAGTDYRRHVAFLTSAEEYRRLLVDTMNLDRVAHPPINNARYLAEREVWETVPPYQAIPPGFEATMRNLATPLLVLALWTAAIAAAALAAVKRVRP